MKKQFVFILLLVTFAISCLALVGCSHSHEFGEWTLSKRATCTEDGQQERFCSCGEKQTSTIAATGHSFGDWSVDKEPTCTEAGQEIKSCSCGETQTRSIDALGHTYQHVVSQPTCLEQGYTTHTCSVCGYSYVDSYVDATGHNYLFGICTVCDHVSYSQGLEMKRGSLFPVYSITGIGTCTDTDIIIPSSINVIPVTSIGDHAFYNCDRITSITIPSSVKSIGEYAFYHCNNLARITLSQSVTSIGAFAFYNCASLTSVTIPEGVESIGDYAFADCPNLKEITISSTVTSIGELAFDNCTSLVSINVDDNNTHFKSVDGNLYTKDDRVLMQYAVGKTDTSFDIPQGVMLVNDFAFRGCTSLTSITIPASVTLVYEISLVGCPNLANIKVDSANPKFKSIDGNLYSSDGTSLIMYTNGKRDLAFEIPQGVTTIADGAFYGCDYLTRITFPNSLTKIGESAFLDFHSLIEVCNKSSLSIAAGSKDYGYVGYQAKRVFKNEEDTVLSMIGDYVFYDDATDVYLVKYVGSNRTLTLPNNFNGKDYGIYSGAFNNNDTITNITIPSGVTSIGESAFNNCSNLKEITIPASVTTIGEYAFEDCSSLNKVAISQGVQSIGQSAFNNCTSLTSITIPSSVTSINYDVFMGCTSLTSITIPSSVTEISIMAFADCTCLKNVYYAGTQEQWNSISIDFGNECLTNATIHFNYSVE